MAVEITADLDAKVAHLPGIQPHMDVVAAKILAKARANAAAHAQTGAYMASLGVQRAGIDRLVYSDDPAAAAIEFGHVTRGKTPKYVRGQRILLNALYGI